MLQTSQCDPSSLYVMRLQSIQYAQSEVSSCPRARVVWKVVEEVADIALSPLGPRKSAMSARQVWGSGGRRGGQRFGLAGLWRAGSCIVVGPGWLASPMRVPRIGSWCGVCVGCRVGVGVLGCWKGLWSPRRWVNVVGVRGCSCTCC